MKKGGQEVEKIKRRKGITETTREGAKGEKGQREGRTASGASSGREGRRDMVWEREETMEKSPISSNIHTAVSSNRCHAGPVTCAGSVGLHVGTSGLNNLGQLRVAQHQHTEQEFPVELVLLNG